MFEEPTLKMITLTIFYHLLLIHRVLFFPQVSSRSPMFHDIF